MVDAPDPKKVVDAPDPEKNVVDAPDPKKNVDDDRAFLYSIPLTVRGCHEVRERDFLVSEISMRFDFVCVCTLQSFLEILFVSRFWRGMLHLTFISVNLHLTGEG